MSLTLTKVMEDGIQSKSTVGSELDHQRDRQGVPKSQHQSFLWLIKSVSAVSKEKQSTLSPYQQQYQLTSAARSQMEKDHSLIIPMGKSGEGCWRSIGFFAQIRSSRDDEDPVSGFRINNGSDQKYIIIQILIKIVTYKVPEDQKTKRQQLQTKATDEDQALLRHLKSFLHDGIYSDVQFVVKGEKIPGHTCIIRTGSPVLDAMFQTDMTEASSRTVVINDVEPIVFRQLLRYLYIGEVPEVGGDYMTEPLFIVADKYGVDSLRDWCGAVMSKKLNVENAMRFLVLAHLHSAKKLETRREIF